MDNQKYLDSCAKYEKENRLTPLEGDAKNPDFVCCHIHGEIPVKELIVGNNDCHSHEQGD